MSEAVALTVEQPIAWVTFDRPQQRNALTLAMYEQLAEICRHADTMDGVRVLVLTGAGGSFVAGMDISELQALAQANDPLQYSRRMDAVFDAVERVKLPTIAAIDGPAVGGGAALAACCDLRLASKRARFGFPVARTVGNALSPRTLTRLVGLVGVGRVKQMLLGAELLEADEMLAAGLVAKLFEAGPDFEQGVRDYAVRISEHAPLTMRATKEVLLELQERLTPSGLDAVEAAYRSNDFREGVSAFLEKRKPAWRGD